MPKKPFNYTLSYEISFYPCLLSLKYNTLLSLKFYKMTLYFWNLSFRNINAKKTLDYMLSCEIPKVECCFVEFF